METAAWSQFHYPHHHVTYATPLQNRWAEALQVSKLAESMVYHPTPEHFFAIYNMHTTMLGKIEELEPSPELVTLPPNFTPPPPPVIRVIPTFQRQPPDLVDADAAFVEQALAPPAPVPPVPDLSIAEVQQLMQIQQQHQQQQQQQLFMQEHASHVHQQHHYQMQQERQGVAHHPLLFAPAQPESYASVPAAAARAHAHQHLQAQQGMLGYTPGYYTQQLEMPRFTSPSVLAEDDAHAAPQAHIAPPAPPAPLPMPVTPAAVPTAAPAPSALRAKRTSVSIRRGRDSPSSDSAHVPYEETDSDERHDKKLKKKGRKQDKRNPISHGMGCHQCGARETPEWRRGPNGSHTLCNACGLRFSKMERKKRAEEGPATVPTSLIEISTNDDRTPSAPPSDVLYPISDPPPYHF